MKNVILNDQSLSFDARSLGDLKRSAASQQSGAIKETAKQFEVLFTNMLMKSMRDASPKDGMMSSSAGDMYTGMLDQQFAQKIASRGTGLADVIARQLGGATAKNEKAASSAALGESSSAVGAEANRATMRALGKGQKSKIMPTEARSISVRFAENNGLNQLNQPSQPSQLRQNQPSQSGQPSQLLPPNQLIRPPKAAVSPPPVTSEQTPAPAGGLAANSSEPQRVGAKPISAAVEKVVDKTAAFFDQMKVHANEAATATGIPAKFMLGQAALESGWGKREIRRADGTPSHNLFGIKAGANWTGSTVSVTTTEYVNGMPRQSVEKFRAYSSYAESFKDYAALITKSPRYSAVIGNSNSVDGFATSLQRAGYATDPRYAEKLSRTINHVIAIARSRTDAPAASWNQA
ncbi:MAG: flagellar assembly peptidoglycan hydrolase FlgJ [Aeromicrobium sp.]|nr:flagellar assembly peptidoglycan hydrolase FlgJ [Burkholderiales bacterium]